MMTTKKLSRREKLELAIAQKQEQLKRLSAQERVKDRKLDTRRKILAGATVLQHAQIDDQFKNAIDRLLNKYLTKDNDRQLFNLKPLSNNNVTKEQGAQ